MVFECDLQHVQGQEFCLSQCPVRGAATFEYVRVEREADRPAPDPRAVDVAVLDMNHGWPNVGHDAIVLGVQTMVCDIREALEEAGLRVRVVSYDVRRGGMIPRPPVVPAGDRASDAESSVVPGAGRGLDAETSVVPEAGIFVGTGGPGHLDPRQNDGRSAGSQTIVEDPRWEAPLFALFDAVRAHPSAALLGVCHTFGVMCRWLDIAAPALRGPDKGGKSAGVLDNLLTPEAVAHPWFRRLAAASPGGPRIRILDNRLYDLLPIAENGAGNADRAPNEGHREPAVATPSYARAAAVGVSVLATETEGVDGPPGDGVTMIEVARDAEGIVPRILGVNHHPEIVNRTRVLMVLWQMRARAEVSHQWYEERAAALTHTLKDADSDRRLDLTSRYTLFEPLRFHLYRQLRLRAERLGAPLALHEHQVLDAAALPFQV